MRGHSISCGSPRKRGLSPGPMAPSLLVFLAEGLSTDSRAESKEGGYRKCHQPLVTKRKSRRRCGISRRPMRSTPTAVASTRAYAPCAPPANGGFSACSRHRPSVSGGVTSIRACDWHGFGIARRWRPSQGSIYAVASNSASDLAASCGSSTGIPHRARPPTVSVGVVDTRWGVLVVSGWKSVLNELGGVLRESRRSAVRASRVQPVSDRSPFWLCERNP